MSKMSCPSVQQTFVAFLSNFYIRSQLYFSKWIANKQNCIKLYLVSSDKPQWMSSLWDGRETVLWATFFVFVLLHNQFCFSINNVMKQVWWVEWEARTVSCFVCMPLAYLQVLYSKVHCPVCCIVDWVTAASHSILVIMWLLQTSLSQKHCPDAVRDFPHGCWGGGARAG